MTLYDFARSIKKMRKRERALVRKQIMLEAASAKFHVVVEKLRKQKRKFDYFKTRTTGTRLNLPRAEERVFRLHRRYLSDSKLRIDILLYYVQTRLMEQEQMRKGAIQEMKRLYGLS